MVGAVQGANVSAAVAAIGGAVFLIFIVVILFYVVASWRLYSKAGVPGWGVLIPIYNIYLWCKIAGRPGWWILLLFVPVVNIIVQLILCLDVAKSFGRSGAFGAGIWLLGFIFVPILGYGSSRYVGPSPTRLA
jgi:hypothetical protein